MGAPRAIALCHNFGGALDFQTGDWNRAEESLAKAVEMYREVGSASGESLSLYRLAVLRTAVGDTEGARDLLNEAVVVAERAAMRSHCLTRIFASLLRNRLAAGDDDGIRESFQEGLEAARRHGHCVTCNALLLPEVVRGALAMEDLDTAEKHAAKLEETAAEFESRAWTAMSRQAWGRVRLARGRFDEAIGEFERASRIFGEIQQSYDDARARLGLALALERRGHDGDARRAEALRTEAQAIFERLGAAGIES